MSYEILPDGQYKWTSTYRFEGRQLSYFYYQMDREHFEWMRDNSERLMVPIQALIDRLDLTDYQITPTIHTELGIEFTDSLILTARLTDSQMTMLRLMQ